MPTYTYRCPVCGHTIEKVHKISEDPEVKCLSCYFDLDRDFETPLMRRVIKNFDNKVLFKGKGWDGVRDYNTH